MELFVRFVFKKVDDGGHKNRHPVPQPSFSNKLKAGFKKKGLVVPNVLCRKPAAFHSTTLKGHIGPDPLSAAYTPSRFVPLY